MWINSKIIPAKDYEIYSFKKTFFQNDQKLFIQILFADQEVNFYTCQCNSKLDKKRNWFDKLN